MMGAKGKTVPHGLIASWDSSHGVIKNSSVPEVIGFGVNPNGILLFFFFLNSLYCIPMDFLFKPLWGIFIIHSHTLPLSCCWLRTSFPEEGTHLNCWGHWKITCVIHGCNTHRLQVLDTFVTLNSLLISPRTCLRHNPGFAGSAGVHYHQLFIQPLIWSVSI